MDKSKQRLFEMMNKVGGMSLNENESNAKKLINDLEKIMQNSEYRTSKVRGVSNLSRSDLEVAIDYANAYIRSGGHGFSGKMSPRGGVKELLDKYGITKKE